MKNNKAVFYLFLVALWAVCMLITFVGFSSASARQEVTATPAAPTIAPTYTAVSSDCPEVLPYGWGTVTPSPLWFAECGDCPLFVTPTVTPTPYIWDGTGTPPAPTFTPLPITPTVTPSSNCGGISYTPPVVSELFPVNWTSIATVTGNDFACTDNGSFLDCGGTVSFVDNDGTQDDRLRMRFNVSLDVGQTYYIKTDILENSCGWSNATLDGARHIAWVGVGTNLPVDLYPFVSPASFVAGSPSGASHVIDFWVYAGCGGTGSASFNYTLQLYKSPECLTITPTPSPSLSYCDTITALDNEFGWDLFIPDGAPNCDLGWQSFEVAGYTIPAVRICFQPSQFGVVTLFGVSYAIGVYALGAAAAFFYRYFRQG